MTTSAGLPQTAPRRPPLRRGAKEAIIALAALPVLLVAGIYLGGRIGTGGAATLQPAAGAAVSPSPLVTVRPATPRPLATVTPPAPAPVVTVTPPAPAPVVSGKPAPAPAGTAPQVAPFPLAAGPVVPARPPVVPPQVLARGSTGADVRVWQEQMARRTWRIRVDGIFGSESAAVARRFQREKGLRVDGLVGRQTWDAAWRLPVRH